jgi:FKBP-type peptidyl-prolyl cis-trans isomerase FkpA
MAGMREGGRRTVMVPSDVGYEDIGSNEIPPNADFTLDIELLSVKPPATS